MRAGRGARGETRGTGVGRPSAIVVIASLIAGAFVLRAWLRAR